MICYKDLHMTDLDIQSKIEKLREEIRNHNFLYYTKSNPIISDEKYDGLLRELKELESRYPLLMSADSPTQKVGAAPVKGFITVEHAAAMLSLDSALAEVEIREFDKRVKRLLGDGDIEYVAEPKLDGLSVEIVYENGRFVRGSTRGDGYRGEDVTQNLKTIKSLPLLLQKIDGIPQFLAVRGEVMMSITGFDRLNKNLAQNGQAMFANPRNAASGSIRQLDSKITASRPLDIFFYDILFQQGGRQFSGHWEILKTLPQWGLKVNPNIKKCDHIEDAIDFHKNMADERDRLDYEIDGVVIKLNDLVARRQLGTKSRSPRWAIAYKFEPRREKTKLEDIVIQVGRTGALTPVALLRPVDVGGVTISRASLHNMDYICKLGVKIGDKVRVERAGDVIPAVTRVYKKERTGDEKDFSLPDKCPVCNSVVIKTGAYHLCSGGISCPAQLKESIKHYASKNAMDIDGLGTKLVDRLVDEGLIGSVVDLYKLKPEQLKSLEGFAEKSSQKLVSAIEKSKNRPFNRFIYALGIKNVGRHLAEVLAANFSSIDALLKETSKDKLMQINEVGPEVAQCILDFFANDRNLELINKLIAQGVVPEKEDVAIENILAGKRFVFTGTLTKLTRMQAQDAVKKLGGRVASAVSAATDYVVFGDNPGSKLAKAGKLGVSTISEDEFLNLIRWIKGSDITDIRYTLKTIIY